MSAVSGTHLIQLAGPPWNLKAVTRIVPPADPVVPITLKLPDGPALHRAFIRPFGPGSIEIRLSLPRETPPGVYQGEVSVGKVQYEASIAVEPASRLRLNPKRTGLTVEPGGRAEFDVIVSNHGNVPIDVPARSDFDLDDAEGQDRALGRSLRATLDAGERRVDRFFDELRSSHGGEAVVAVLDGTGPLEPGDSRTLHCRLEVPLTTVPGRSWIGAWQVAGTSHVVEVEVARGASTKPGITKGGITPVVTRPTLRAGRKKE